MQKITGYEPQNLAALVDGTLGKASLNPPSGGWPTGASFRLNLVQDDRNLNAILAQSPEFSILPSSSTIGSCVTPFIVPCRLIHIDTNSTTTQGTATAGVVTPTDPSNTDPITVPTSAAMSDRSLNAVLLVFFSWLGFAMA